MKFERKLRFLKGDSDANRTRGTNIKTEPENRAIEVETSIATRPEDRGIMKQKMRFGRESDARRQRKGGGLWARL